MNKAEISDNPPPLPLRNSKRFREALTFSCIGLLMSCGCVFLGDPDMSSGLNSRIAFSDGFFCIFLLGLCFAQKIRKRNYTLLMSGIWIKANVTRVQRPSSAEGDNDWWLKAETMAAGGLTLSFTSDPVSRATAERHGVGSQLWVLMSRDDHTFYRVVIDD